MSRDGCVCAVVGLILLLALGAMAAEPVTPGDAMLAKYFRAETATVAKRSLAEVRTLADWSAKRDEYRQQLAEMLGLWPMPERTDLKVTITGTVDHPEFTVQKLHFQSRPGLYVTANLYVPKNLAAPAPAILYVCGHAQVKKDGIAYGAKAFYQHHGAWFARNGYVCLIPDTLVNGVEPPACLCRPLIGGCPTHGLRVRQSARREAADVRRPRPSGRSPPPADQGSRSGGIGAVAVSYAYRIRRAIGAGTGGLQRAGR